MKQYRQATYVNSMLQILCTFSPKSGFVLQNISAFHFLVSINKIPFVSFMYGVGPSSLLAYF